MLEIGRFNDLVIKREVDFGFYLETETFDILLPKKYIPEGAAIGDTVHVFIYKDSEDRLVATNLVPKVQRDGFGFLLVKDVNKTGAFLNWGLEKDLLVPFSEQGRKMDVGHSYIIFVFLDEQSQRLTGTAHYAKHLMAPVPEDELAEGMEVNVLVAEESNLGYKAIVNNKWPGLIYKNEIFRDLNTGDQLKAYIKKIREDGKLDISLQKQGVVALHNARDIVLARLKEQEGYLPLTDSSNPEEIYLFLQMSKKAFKKAVGILYKERLISLEEHGIRLL